MANDPSMPPSEQADRVPTDNSPAMSQAPMAPQGPAGGNVMVNIPMAEFEEIYKIILKLAIGMGQLRKSAMGRGAAAPAAPMAAPAPATEPSTENESGEDEDFLKGVAEEGNKS
jgi:hypothetical protein